MSNFSDQLEEIKTLISSAAPKQITQSFQSLLHWIVADVHDEDEEIATQALKCLGFMIYHPSIHSQFQLVLESLVKLITTTKMKSVCNLGVWCISIQQLSEALLAPHFHSLLRAVVHAIDNPIGSLSTTFEAIQAVVKLASLLSLQYTSSNKSLQGTCQRFEEKLLTGMHDMLTNGMKVQTIQAWGWFIRLLGSHALKNRHLINDMLKIPEKTFSDHDSQVQIATQVAWEGLIDALIHPPMLLPCETNAAKEDDGTQKMGSHKGNSGEIQKNGSLKSIRLIMTPLIGIMSSNCDLSVHLACLNTWCYLLHKLDTSLNDSLMINLVVKPIFEAVFQIDPDGKSFWARDLCINLLDDFISAKSKHLDYDPRNQVSQQLSAKTSMNVPFISGSSSWKQYPVKWLPWDLSLLDFHLKMIYSFIRQPSRRSVCHDNRVPADDASLRLFRAVLKGVELEFKKSSINYDDIMFCLNAILKFIKDICEEVSLDGSDRNGSHHISLQFMEAVSEEIEPTIVGSPLYKVALNIKNIENLQMIPDVGYEKLGVCSIGYMEMVSPMVYLSVLYFSVVVQSTLSTSKTDYILLGMQQYFKFMCLDKYTSMLTCANKLDLNFKDLDLHLISLYADAFICILENSCSSELSSEGNTKHGCDYKISSGIKGCLTLAIRYVKLLQTKIGTDTPIGLRMISRVYSALAHFIRSLHLKQDIVSFFEMISCPLLEWLRHMEMQDESILINLNSHPSSRKLLITQICPFQNQPSTFGTPHMVNKWSTGLFYPQALLHVLDKLWRNGRINLHRRSLPLQRCQSRSEAITLPTKVYGQYNNNRGSKRVELVEDTIGSEHKEMPHSSLKRKRLELTEHQKEVRRAQRGRERDCGRHGMECILQMLRNR
ncbi:hypothetical protein M0R45_030202 [Rubus argutus]|uniref:Telomere-associated protein Rif1 N-terminal domain-containing protein n=1 Tax=Rubus argutus TaxID=59490 RepID=A0AAW1WCW6_RUBAR